MAAAPLPRMVTSVERILLLRPFQECARKHARERRLLDQLDECVKLIWQEPSSRGLNLEQLRVCGGHPVLSARINQQFRLILVQLSTREFGLLHFDNHDEAYAWVDRNAANVPKMLGGVEELRRGYGPIARPVAFPRADEEDPIALRDAGEFGQMLEALRSTQA